MRITSVAQFLETRLRLDATMIDDLVVDVDAVPILRSGLVSGVIRHDCRFLAEVAGWKLLPTGHVDAARAWVKAGGQLDCVEVRNALLGHIIAASQLATVSYSDRAIILMIYRASGRSLDSEEVAALQTAPSDAPDPAGLAAIERLRADPQAQYWTFNDHLPIEPAPLDQHPALDTFLSSGDLPSCLRQLEAAIERADALEAVGTPYQRWDELAEVMWFLTADEAAAEKLLQRICFADAGEHWVKLFGQRGAARVQREKAEVLAVIEAAFNGIDFPGPEHMSLYQAEAEDTYDSCDQSRDHKGRWQDLPRTHILECQWALSYLGKPSLPYYLPAIMSFVVREYDLDADDHKSRWIFHSLECHLRFDETRAEQSIWFKERHSWLTPTQLRAIARFAEYYRCSDADRKRWHMIAEHGMWPHIEEATPHPQVE